MENFRDIMDPSFLEENQGPSFVSSQPEDLDLRITDQINPFDCSPDWNFTPDQENYMESPVDKKLEFNTQNLSSQRNMFIQFLGSTDPKEAENF